MLVREIQPNQKRSCKKSIICKLSDNVSVIGKRKEAKLCSIEKILGLLLPPQDYPNRVKNFTKSLHITKPERNGVFDGLECADSEKNAKSKQTEHKRT